jgi:hypothetical protein
MNNWEGGEDAKHFLDRDSGERPHVRVAYLDLYEQPGSAVNGVALPVDASCLAAFDAREINYERIEISDAFELTTCLGAGHPSSPADPPSCVFTYVGLDTARERCRQGAVDGSAFASRDYAAGVRLAFERLGAGAVDEFDRTTDPLPFPERDLRMILPAGTCR